MSFLHLSTIAIFVSTLQLSIHAKTYNIGGAFSTPEQENAFRDSVQAVNSNSSKYGLSNGRLNASMFLLNADPLIALKDICDKLINNSVYIVLTDRAVNSTRDPYIVSHACAFYHIPVIGISARDSEFSEKDQHGFFLRTVPSIADQARPLVDLVKSFKWGKVILVTSDSQDYRKLFIKFTSLAYDQSISVEHPVIFPSGLKNLTIYLKDIPSKHSKVIIFGSSLKDAAIAYRDAATLGLTGAGYSWIVTEEAGTGSAMQNAPQGLLTLKLKQGSDFKSHIADAVMIAARSIGQFDLNTSTITQPPSSCNEKPGLWTSGKSLYKAMVNKTYFSGKTGDVKLDSFGDRVNAAYEIYNLNVKESNGDKYLKKVGDFEGDGNISVQQNLIRWPGNQTQKPKGVFVSNHLRIVTVESHPFVSTKPMPASKNCADINLVVRGTKRQFVKCVGPSAVQSGNEHCCMGFCIDLLLKLANKTNFTYDLHLSGDKQFGSLTKKNGSNVKRWNGAVGEVIDGKADLIVASITINNERAQYIEFSKPFKYQGISILVKTKPTVSKLDSFLRPFKTELWLLVLLSVHIVAVILYLLDRFSPFGRYQRAKANKQEIPLDLPSAMWFSWGVLLNSGIGEVTPRSFSARVLGMVWAAFAMIIVASYTANLAAFLVLDRPKPVVSGIDDPNLRNPSDTFKYNTVTGSSVEGYFKRQVELSNMYTFMEKYNVKTESEGIRLVREGAMKAFIWDSPVLYYETSSDCSLSTAGELFGRSGYGVGMPKGSPWSSNISLAILQFHESGIMEQLETSWIDFGSCPKQTSSPTTLGLSHMLGVFIMVAVGIGAGIIIVILEVVYYRRKGMRKEERELAAKYCEQWKTQTDEGKKKKKGKLSVVFTGVHGYEMNGNGTKAAQTNQSYEPDILHHS